MALLELPVLQIAPAGLMLSYTGPLSVGDVCEALNDDGRVLLLFTNVPNGGVITVDTPGMRVGGLPLAQRTITVGAVGAALVPFYQRLLTLYVMQVLSGNAGPFPVMAGPFPPNIYNVPGDRTLRFTVTAGDGASVAAVRL